MAHGSQVYNSQSFGLLQYFAQSGRADESAYIARQIAKFHVTRDDTPEAAWLTDADFEGLT